jgi:hypothetical protein
MTDAQVMARDERGTRGSLKSFFWTIQCSYQRKYWSDAF